MRITTQMMVDQALDRLQSSQSRMDRTRERLSSGREIRRPSDDPSGASRVLALQADLRARDQEGRNADDANTLLNLADSGLQSIVARLHRVRDLLVAGASEQQGDSRIGMASEIDAIRDEVVAVANARHDGRPLFSGFADADAVQFVAGQWIYGGDAGAVHRRVGPEDVVQVNVSAEEAFGVTAGGGGGDLFTLLDDIQAAMLANDQTAVANAITDLDGHLTSIGVTQAKIGAAANRVEAAQTRNMDAQLAIRGEMSVVQDTNIAEAIMELQLQEMSYEATLAALGRSLPQSLVSFLR